jgi:site-specific recombinase XerD
MKTAEGINRFNEYCENKGCSQETIRWYDVILKQFAGQFKELPDQPETLEEFIHDYPGSDERKHGIFRCLRAFYRFLNRRLNIPNLISKIDPPKVKHKEKTSLSLDEVKRLLQCPDNPRPIVALFFLYADSGCRFSEAYNLKKSNIMGDRVKIDGKTGERIIPLSPVTRDLLTNLTLADFYKGRHKIIKNDPDRVFCWSRDGLDKEVRDAFKRVGLKGRNHTWRHTFCSLADLDVLELRKITGHTNYAVLERYVHHKIDRSIQLHAHGSPLAQLSLNNKQGDYLSNSAGDMPTLSEVDNKILLIVPVSLLSGKTLHLSLS